MKNADSYTATVANDEMLEAKKRAYAFENATYSLPGGYHRCLGAEGCPFTYIGDHFTDIVGFTRDELMNDFGGSNKNIGIGCADGRVGKAMIHTTPGSPDMWDIATEEFMERMTESTKAVTNRFGDRIVYINVLRNMSVSCDCEGCAAMPVVTPNIGIVASRDILAVDQASVDLVYSLAEGQRRELCERIETRHGHRQLSYMKELGMGNDRYRLLDIDDNDNEISTSDAVADVVPFSLEFE